MLGNTDVNRSRALKQALLSEARHGGEKPRGGKPQGGKAQSRPAKGAPFGAGGQDPAAKERDAKPGNKPGSKPSGGKPKKAKPASKPGKPTKHRKGPPKTKAAGGSDKVYGVHAVEALLRHHPKRVKQLWLAESRHDPRVQALVELAGQFRVPVGQKDRRELDEWAEG
eukprot:gene21090-25843_t